MASSTLISINSFILDKKLLNIDITEINIVSPIDLLNEMED